MHAVMYFLRTESILKGILFAAYIHLLSIVGDPADLFIQASFSHFIGMESSLSICQVCQPTQMQ